MIEWHNLPSLTALRAFAATAELRNFSQAARALNVTHAAVAQQVRGLEEALGRPLVQREGRGVSLTTDGEQLAAALAEGFGAMQRGLEALRVGEADRPVRITLTAAFATQWLMPRLKDFWQKHPDIGLSLHPDSKVVDLHRERMDVGIRYGNGNWPGVETEYLTSARLVIAGAPSLIGNRDPTIADMAGMDWILSRNWPEQDAYLRQLGLDPAKLSSTDISTEELALAAARQGLGLVVESVALIETDVAEGRLRIVHESREKLPAYFIVSLPGPKRAAARAFLKWLRSLA
ncbi:LysR family transcriptional regulator [Rhodobacter calidifons]|uniref:LysR family transcriptional regulator n=1 Tax=Rhodobacter calidifons TaxID=2715277 RepID=A0ABX0G5S6_9RHOB|nr:LysR family transcriptional regulator [Rhodobacter calidifons]NHB76613.1 LysR family transcriptional regulator [Rhodobacter calidifons]